MTLTGYKAPSFASPLVDQAVRKGLLKTYSLPTLDGSPTCYSVTVTLTQSDLTAFASTYDTSSN